MRTLVRSLTGLVVLVALLAAGCGGEAGRAGGKSGGQATPKNTIRTLSDALENGRKDAFVSCFKLQGRQREYLGANFDMGYGIVRLRKALEETYGSDAWQKFREAGGHWGAGFEVATDEMLDRVVVKIDGDKAACTMPDETEPMLMVKVGGAWLIDLSTQLPADDRVPEAMKAMALTTAAVEKGIAQVGKPGQSPESVNRLVCTEMTRGLMGGAPVPVPPAE